MQRTCTPITLIHFRRIFASLLFLFVITATLSAQDYTWYIVREIRITGNKVTKPFIIERELTIHRGDTFGLKGLSTQFSKCKQNLLNTSLFNFVEIGYVVEKDTTVGADSVFMEPGSDVTLRRDYYIVLTVDVKERWYTWPAPVFDVAEQNINTWWRNGHNLKRATYGFMLTRYNFRGRRQTVALICRFGYAQQFGGQYSVPYINRKQTLGLTFTGLYTRYHEVSYGTNNNNLLFYKDKDNYIRKEISGSIKAVYRKEIYHRHSLEAKFTDLLVNDTVTDLAPDYFLPGDEHMRYFTLSYQYVNDHRDARYYPLKGYYGDFEITRHGLGILPGEDLNVTFLAASLRKYAPVARRVFGGAMVRGRWMPMPDPPYYHQRALGFSTYIRGFEYYVIDGQSYVVAKSSVKYQLLKPRVFKFNWLPLEKFNMFHLAIYTGLFCDAGYVHDRTSTVADNNHLGNEWLTGYGAAIDLVTYYDIVFRLEYTFNNLGENGFFLHMGAPF